MDTTNGPKQVDLTITIDELLLLNNSLNEVLNGIEIDKVEFSTRLGTSVEEAAVLQKRLNKLLKEHRV